MQLCLVFLKPVPPEKASFATLVPRRLARIVGDEVAVYVLYAGHISDDELAQQNITSIRYDRGLGRLCVLKPLNLVIKVLQLAIHERVDVFMNVWAHYALFGLGLSTKLARCRLIARVAGLPIRGMDPQLPPWKRVKRWMGLRKERLSLAMADHVQVLSTSLLNELERRGINSEKCSVLSQGIDTDHFAPDPREDVSASGTQVLYVGRLERAKGVDTLIRSFAQAIVTLSGEPELWLAGEGRAEAALRNLTRELGIEDHVRFLGYVGHDELPGLYRRSDLLVLPSHSEGLSNVVLEAQACALPVIATNVGELPGQVADGRGLIVEVGDVRALAEGMVRLLSDPELRAQMGRRGRAHVESEHAFPALRDRYMAMFEGVLATAEDSRQ